MYFSDFLKIKGTKGRVCNRLIKELVAKWCYQFHFPDITKVFMEILHSKHTYYLYLCSVHPRTKTHGICINSHFYSFLGIGSMYLLFLTSQHSFSSSSGYRKLSSFEQLFLPCSSMRFDWKLSITELYFHGGPPDCPGNGHSQSSSQRFFELELG